MTDKQIIIDDVDVSGCRFYALQEHYDMESDGLWKVCYSKDYKYSICANNPNCYYKEFKRKEQECEKLKFDNFDLNDRLQHTEFILETAKETKKLKEQQLDQLKTELRPFKDEYFKGLENVAIAGLAKKSIRITAENCKLTQTLIEIKEILSNKNWSCGENNHTNCNLKNECGEYARLNILQKISEVYNAKTN